MPNDFMYFQPIGGSPAQLPGQKDAENRRRKALAGKMEKRRQESLMQGKRMNATVPGAMGPKSVQSV